MNTPIYVTKRLILRKFTLEDAEHLYEVLKDEETCKFLPMYPLKSIDEARSYIQENYISKYDLEGDIFYYAICTNKKNIPIGYIKVSDDESHDLGYCLRKDLWGEGYMTEACLALLKVLRDSSIPYITATHDKNNIGSRRVLEKIGMEYKYSYREMWKPKDFEVIFRMYQLNLIDGIETYTKYLDKYDRVEEDV